MAPERFRTLQRMERIDRRRRILKGGPIREDEGNRLTGLDRELTDRFEVVTVKGGWGSQDQALRADNRVDRAIVESADPWHGCPVIETHHKLGTKNHSPRPTNHDPHKIGAVCRRHEIDNGCRAGLSLKFGFEDEGAGAISPSHAAAADALEQ